MLLSHISEVMSLAKGEELSLLQSVEIYTYYIYLYTFKVVVQFTHQQCKKL